MRLRRGLSLFDLHYYLLVILNSSQFDKTPRNIELLCIQLISQIRLKHQSPAAYINVKTNIRYHDVIPETCFRHKKCMPQPRNYLSTVILIRYFYINLLGRRNFTKIDCSKDLKLPAR